MKTVKGWWFAALDRRLANGDGRIIRIGRTHKVKGEIVPCEHGLHLSKKPLDALRYAPGPVVYKVGGSGIIVPHGYPVDKYACSERTYLAGGVDASKVLGKFARMCALDVIHLWNAPDVVVKWLRTGDENLRLEAGQAAAQGAAWAMTWAARQAAQAAARAAARATWTVAWAAREAAQAAACQKQNKRLSRMLTNLINKKK